MEMPFRTLEANSEASNILHASISECGSSNEESPCTDSTSTDSNTSYYHRFILHNRFSRPQFVDQWSIYVLGRKPSDRTEDVRDKLIWRRALICVAREPLSKADFFGALEEVLRRSSIQKHRYRMIYHPNRLHRGVDGMGYELMHAAKVLTFVVTLVEGTSLKIRKEDSCDCVWRKDLDWHLGDNALIYTSEQLLSDFTRYFDLRKAAYVKSSSCIMEEDVLARFQAVCHEEHFLCCLCYS